MPSTSVPSVPSVPKRARAAVVVKSFVFEARMRGVLLAPAEDRAGPVAAQIDHICARIGAGGPHVAGQALHDRGLVLRRGGGGQQGEQGYDEQGDAAHQRPGTR